MTFHWNLFAESCVLAWSVVRCNLKGHFKTMTENTNRWWR